MQEDTGFHPTILGKELSYAFLANLIWINVSEVFRYFAFVMPMMRDALRQLPNVAPMNIPVFLIWGIWDMLLIIAATGFTWLVFERFGRSIKNAILSGTALWAMIFVILWLGLWNMNLAPIGVVAVALPLAWIEMVVASLIVWAFHDRTPRTFTP